MPKPPTLLFPMPAFLVSRAVGDVGVSGLDGTSRIGLGRTSVDAKIALITEPDMRLSFYSAVFMPSPSSDQLAGTATTSIFPRLIGAANVLPDLALFGDVGYEYDFNEATLRRFAWSLGTSYAAANMLSLDFGVNGSLYDKGIPLFHDEPSLSSAVFGPVTITSLDPIELPTNFVDLVVGLTVPVSQDVFISGTATIPVVNVDFRPQAIGTISAQVVFEGADRDLTDRGRAAPAPRAAPPSCRSSHRRCRSCTPARPA